MSHPRIRAFKQTLLWVGMAFVVPFGDVAMAQSRAGVDTTADNLMAVLRESFGANKQDEELKPTGKVRAKLPDGKEVEFEMASFEFIGDMHIRFVFDGPQTMVNATPQDLARLNLNADQALRLALSNIKRVYGAPSAKSWTGGLMQVQGKSPDLDSSYFLDRDFWRALVKKHPEGLVVAVPKRGGLVFAPLSDARAVDGLKKNVAYLHSSSERFRVSGALYLFKDDRWTVFQPTHVQK
jgi:uncharacterized protein YtpQ (UPF0354 family)